MSRPVDVTVLSGSLPAVAQGLALTVGVWLAASILGATLGAALAVLHVIGGKWVRRSLRAYIEVFRGTPFLVQLFILYYGGPACGLALKPLTAGIIALSLYGSPFFAETFRAGFLSVPRGHIEAAECLGLSRLQVILRVQLPQMLVLIVPALTNIVVVLSKETAVLSVVTVPELTFVLTGIGTAKFAFVETLLVLCACYLALVELTAHAGQWIEGRVGLFLAR